MSAGQKAVLHIANDFSSSKVHSNLYCELECRGWEQIIFVPLRHPEKKGNYEDRFDKGKTTIVYSDLIKTYHRILFWTKIKMLYRSLVRQVDLSELTLTHATTLFSDGAVSYLLFKRYKIPYIVAVRGTDIDIFMKYRKELLPVLYKILKNASRIIFISDSLRERFVNHYLIAPVKDKVVAKSQVIYNGIDEFWLSHRVAPPPDSGMGFLFVGRFFAQKNLTRVIKAMRKIKEDYPDIALGVVGGGGNQEKKAIKLMEKNRPWVRYYGMVRDRDKLLKIFRSYNFLVLPSYRETFGLVYIEAMSQGMPVLYSKGCGIDGIFNDSVGIGVSPHSCVSVREGIKMLIENHGVFNLTGIPFNQFSWKNIALKYTSIYESVI